MKEQDFLEAISQAEQDRVKFKGKISKLQKQILDYESDLIEVSIRKDKLLEELRRFRAADSTYVPDSRDKEIEAFRLVFPEYSKRIDEENKGGNLKK